MFASHEVLLLILFVEREQFLATGEVFFFCFLNGTCGLLLFFHALLQLIHFTFVLVFLFLLHFGDFFSLILKLSKPCFVYCLCVFLNFLDGFSGFFKLFDVLNERLYSYSVLLMHLEYAVYFVVVNCNHIRALLQQVVLMHSLSESDLPLSLDLSSRFLF